MSEVNLKIPRHYVTFGLQKIFLGLFGPEMERSPMFLCVISAGE